MSRFAPSRFLITALALLLGVAAASAQAIIGNPKPQFEISGWSYKLLGQDVHGYTCQTQCAPGSSVSYRWYGPDFNTSMTVAQFREQQGQAAKMLQERLPPGSKIEIVGVTEEKLGDSRVLRSQRLTTFENGRKQHVISSFVFGPGTPFSLISSGDDEAAVKANFTQFLAATMLVARMGSTNR